MLRGEGMGKGLVDPKVLQEKGAGAAAALSWWGATGWWARGELLLPVAEKGGMSPVRRATLLPSWYQPPPSALPSRRTSKEGKIPRSSSTSGHCSVCCSSSSSPLGWSQLLQERSSRLEPRSVGCWDPSSEQFGGVSLEGCSARRCKQR